MQFGYDEQLEAVRTSLLMIADLETKVSSAIRSALDHVIDGRHTGRYRIEQLDKNEKTFIGTKVEHFLLFKLGLPKQPQGQLDTLIARASVDIKWTSQKAWMIPKEALDQLCLLVTANDNRGTFSLGLVRAYQAYFENSSRNGDGKYNLPTGHSGIRWLIRDGVLRENTLLHLPAIARERLLATPQGQARVDEFFRLCPGKIVDGVVIETLAAQRDSSKRVRDGRPTLLREGLVICSNQPKYKNLPPKYGLRNLMPGEFVSIEVVGEDLAVYLVDNGNEQGED